MNQAEEDERIEHSKPRDQDKSQLEGVERTSSDAKEAWTTIVKKKISPPTMQPMVIRSRTHNQC